MVSSASTTDSPFGFPAESHEHLLARDSEAVPAALGAVRADLAVRRIPPELAQAIELALAEGLNNAVLHGCSGAAPGASVRLRWGWEPPRFIAEIWDPGVFSAEKAAERDRLPGEATAEGGRGLFLMRSLCDRVEHARHAGGHLLRLEKAAGGPSTAAENDAQVAEAAIAELGAAYETINVLLGFSGALALAEPFDRFAVRILARLSELFPGVQLNVWVRAPGDGSLQTVEGAAGDPAVRFFAQEAASAGEEILEQDADGGTVFARPCSDQGAGLSVLTASKRAGVPFFVSAELAILRAAADLLGAAQAGAIARARRERAMRIEREIEIAASIQASLLPRDLPGMRAWQLFGSCTPALETGGDFYDVIRRSDGSLLLVVADVMGKGLSSALVASALRAALRARADVEPTPAALLTAVNRSLAADLIGVGVFVTLLLVQVTDAADGVRIAGAGHPPPAVVAPGESPRFAPLPKGPPVGVLAEWIYADAPLHIPEGGTALLFTDGLYEFSKDGGEAGNIEDFLEVLRGVPANLALPGYAAALLEATTPPHIATADDRTLLALRHRPQPQS
jgi:serine phosphatase RsbU (regulator of sigma subunit)/anti-sigma regulatory factor (Ser/Thr protein kinase)